MNMSITLEKEIPLPAVKGRSSKYPYTDMDIGDSFLISGLTMQVVCNMNYRAGRRSGYKFVARTEPAGIRVWRQL